MNPHSLKLHVSPTVAWTPSNGYDFRSPHSVPAALLENAHESEEAGAAAIGVSSSTPGLPQAPGRECVFIRMDADDITFLQPVVLWSSAPSAAAEVTSTVQQ